MRFYPLSVDRLEDRYVPTAVTDLQAVTVAPAIVTVSTDPTAGATVIQPPTGNTQFVIDVYPNDPNGLPDNPIAPIDLPVDPGTGWSDPVEIVPPIDDPFWY